MKKRIFSLLMTWGMVLILLFTFSSDFFPTSVAYAETDIISGISIDDEYIIPDSSGYFVYYVLVATNKNNSDVCISADFVAKDSKGNEIKKVSDYSDAVKKGQQFILYGQFNTSVAQNADDYEYRLSVSPLGSNKSAYNAVDIDTKEVDHALEVSATNMMGNDIQSVNVRTVFVKNGNAVAFDTVNIADSGTVFHGGSSNSQTIGYFAGDYDDFILTYTTSSSASLEDI